MTLKELQEKQAELNKEVMPPCPKCGTEQEWGIHKSIGGCLECYYRAQKDDTLQD